MGKHAHLQYNQNSLWGEKKNVLQLAQVLKIELQPTLATHYIYMLWILMDKLHEL
jgi:hypothetical protein